MDRACELMMGHADEPLSTLEVCSRVGTSRRKLNYCFQDVLGTTPTKYLRLLCLNSVCRALRHAAPGVTLQDVASQWGYWHLDQFAQDYKHLFGELPSATLKVLENSKNLRPQALPQQAGLSKLTQAPWSGPLPMAKSSPPRFPR